jgi:hypothetical protein
MLKYFKCECEGKNPIVNTLDARIFFGLDGMSRVCLTAKYAKKIFGRVVDSINNYTSSKTPGNPITLLSL